MFLCKTCGNIKYFVIGKETFWVGRGITKFWCANVVRCTKCNTFLEPAYYKGIHATENVVEYEKMDPILRIIKHDRTKELNKSMLRPLEKPGVWA